MWHVCVQGFGGEAWEKEKHLEDLGVDAKDNVKIGLQEVGRGSMDWIDLACDRDLWRAHVNVLVKLEAS